MWSFYPWYHLPVCASGLLALGLAIYAWRFRTSPGALPSFVLFLLLAIWSLGSVVEIGASALAAKMLMVKIEYIGIVFVPIAWLALVLDYLGYRYFLTRRNLLVLAIVPTVALLLNWTNSLHYGFYAKTGVVFIQGIPVLELSYGPGCWGFVLYSYLACTAGLLLCVLAIPTASAVYRRQALLLFFSALLPFVADIVYVIHVPWVGMMDLTPLVFTISTGLFLWGMVSEKLLRLAPIAFPMIVESIADGVIVLDVLGHMVEINPAACRMLGLTRRTALSGDLAILPATWADLTTAARSQDNETPRCLTIEDEEQHTYEARIMPMTTLPAGSIGNIILLRDVTESSRLEEQLKTMAFYDSLTGLPNRALFFDRFAQALARNSRQQTATALFYLDLDRFKEINDTLGHAMGDELLRQVAQRMHLTIRECDTLARLGGDEFVIIMPDLDEYFNFTSASNRLHQVFREPFLLGHEAVQVEPSIGLAIAPVHGNDCDHLLSYADHAMYTEKEAKRYPQVLLNR